MICSYPECGATYGRVEYLQRPRLENHDGVWCAFADYDILYFFFATLSTQNTAQRLRNNNNNANAVRYDNIPARVRGVRYDGEAPGVREYGFGGDFGDLAEIERDGHGRSANRTLRTVFYPNNDDAHSGGTRNRAATRLKIVARPLPTTEEKSRLPAP